MRIVLLMAILALPKLMFSQPDLRIPVDIEVREMIVHDVLDTLEDVSGVVMVYGHDNIPDIALSLHLSGSLEEVIADICAAAGLRFQIIGDAVVFAYDFVVEDFHSLTEENEGVFLLDDSIKGPTRPPILVIQDRLLMRPFLPVSIPVDPQIPCASYGRSRSGTERSIVSRQKDAANAPGRGVFLNYSIDFHDFAWLEPEISFQEYVAERNVGATVGGYYNFLPRLFFSFGVGYCTKDFSLLYNYEVLDLQDPIPIPRKTTVSTEYVQLPLGIVYDLFSSGTYSICVSGGFYSFLLSRTDEETLFQNRDGMATDYLSRETREFLYAHTAGLIVRRAITHVWGIYVTPAWYYFPSAVNDKVTRCGSTLYQVRAGMYVGL